MIRSYIALGSNRGQPRQHIDSALASLADLPDSQLVAVSRLFGTTAVGPGKQDDYINAVAALDTALAPEALLDALQQIETEHGRLREVRWGPRSLDLDILLYGDDTIDTPRLQIPHPRMLERAFVLCPLADIHPEFIQRHGLSGNSHVDYRVRDDVWLLEDSTAVTHFR